MTPFPHQVAAMARCLAERRGRSVEPLRHWTGGDLPDAATHCDSVDAMVAAYERDSSTRDERKDRGAFWTPRELADAISGLALDASSRSARICDPSCGGGAFLLAALRRGRVRAEQLYGVDVDPGAVACCRIAIWLESPEDSIDPTALDRQIVVADSLLDELPWGSFDVVIGNPPWNIEKPDSRAFFSRVDPRYGRLTKTEGLQRQRELFEEHPGLEARWDAHCAQHAARGRAIRKRFPLAGGGAPNPYRAFIELGLQLLRDGGRLGMLVPAGIHADLSCAALRRTLLEQTDWQWLIGFENRQRLFAEIDGRFKFDAFVATKGRSTAAVKTRFMVQSVDELESGALRMTSEQLQRFSPKSSAFLELEHERDLEILDRIAQNNVRLGSTDWGISFRRELDQTLDAHRFVTRDQAEAQGCRRDEHDRWIRDGRALVPTWEGRMLGAFDFSAAGWVEGRGRRARWRKINYPKSIEPQFLLSVEDALKADPEWSRPKVGFMAVSSATNTRTMVAAPLLRAPCGNSIPTLRPHPGLELALCAVLNSFVFDWVLRRRLAANNVNRFVLDETWLPPPERLSAAVGIAVAALSWTHVRFAEPWLALRPQLPENADWTELWATTPNARRRLRTRLDAVVAHAFGLSASDLDWILRTDRTDAKGFWRVDKELAERRRATAATRRAFDALERWSDRTGAPQTAAARLLKPRVDQPSPAGSWALCLQHAEAAAKFDPR